MSTSKSKRSHRKHSSTLKKSSYENYVSACRRFVERSTYEAKRQAYDELPKFNITRPLVDQSRMLFELSLIAPDKETKDSCLIEAATKAHTAKYRAIDTQSKLQSGIHEATFPLLIKAHHEKEHADNKATERCIETLGTTIIEFYNTNPFSKQFAQHDSSLGNAAEATILLALLAYTYHEIGTGDTTIVPSLFSEDHVSHASKINQTNWDISVLECSGVLTNAPSSKVQVKYVRRDDSKDITYHQDIDEAGIIPDLFPRGINAQIESLQLARACLNGNYERIEHDVNRLVTRIFD